eukprot:scaffold85064_cov33-Tisochrysis_lutea.AAC.3
MRERQAEPSAQHPRGLPSLGLRYCQLRHLQVLGLPVTRRRLAPHSRAGSPEKTRASRAT